MMELLKPLNGSEGVSSPRGPLVIGRALLHPVAVCDASESLVARWHVFFSVFSGQLVRWRRRRNGGY